MTSDEALEIDVEARAFAASQLRARGIDPRACLLLLSTLEFATVQAVVAFHAGRDEAGEYRQYLDQLYAVLDADPVTDDPPTTPRRTLNPRLLDSGWRSGVA